MKKFIQGIALASLTSLSTAALADIYIGVNVGQAEPDVSGFDSDTSFGMLAGYNLNEYFAVEVNYTDLGQSSDNVDPVWTISSDGFGAALVGRYAVKEQLEVFAKVGAFAWDAELSEAGAGTIASDDGTDLAWALGAAYSFTDNIHIVGQFRRFDIADGDVDNITIGANFSF